MDGGGEGGDLDALPARDLVRVEVTDTRDDRLLPARPRLPQDPAAEAGRGLRPVSCPVSRMCVAPREDGGPGKTVRAEPDL